MFNPIKGFGFIESDGREHYFHYTDFDVSLPRIKEGENVSFKLMSGGIRQRAVDVQFAGRIDSSVLTASEYPRVI